MTPGKYNLNMNALNCMKDKDGYCIHNPAPKTQFNADYNKSMQLNNEDVAISESESEDCARINSVDKWPRVRKRLWKLKQQKVSAKRMKLVSESDNFIELGVDDVVIQNDLDESAINLNRNSPVIRTDVNLPLAESIDRNNEERQEIVEIPTSVNQSKKPKPQFRSTHFDIRSSPIKLPSALVRKFQLDPQKMTKMRSFEVQILRPLSLGTGNDDSQNTTQQEPIQTFEVTLGENNLQEDTAINDELTFHNPEDWCITEPSGETHDLLFEPSLSRDEKDVLDSTLMTIKEKSSLFEQSSKPNILVSTMIHDDKTKNSIEPSLIHITEKSDCLFKTSNSNIMDIGKNPSGYFEPSAIHVKISSDSLIDPSMIHVDDKSFEAALSTVRERSNHLFEPAMLHTKSNSLIDAKTNDMFDSSLPHLHQRSSSLYDSGLMHMKDKDSLIGPSLIHVNGNNIYNSCSQGNDNLMEPMTHDKSNVLIDSALMDVKEDLRSEVDIGDENDLNGDDSRLLSEGQSVLNFLESLSNEPLGLAYPETEIRNNVADFQLDLFPFNSA